jgi:peptidoglycan/LPS O-acetylase OafA/YrhL
VERTDANIDLLMPFWIRRAKRLAPRCCSCCSSGFGLYAAFIRAADGARPHPGRRHAASFGYFANWRFVFLGASYFDNFTPRPAPMRHLWSLARRGAVLPGVAVASPTARAPGLARLRQGAAGRHRAAADRTSAVLMGRDSTHPGSDPVAGLLRTDTRAQSLLIGAALGVILFFPFFSPARPDPEPVRPHRGARRRRRGCGLHDLVVDERPPRTPTSSSGGFVVSCWRRRS